MKSAKQANFTGRNAGATDVSGTAETDPITSSVDITLTCTTLGGQTREETTTISVLSI